jgi:CxxC-x17-CxxC domain-containing protein
MNWRGEPWRVFSLCFFGSSIGAEMAFQDRDLICRDCGGSFVFTAGEQEFYATKGLEHDPVRCPNCRATRKLMSPEDREVTPTYGVYASWGGRTPRQLYLASCAQCAGITEVPFRPRDDRPVYCSDCYGDLRKKQEAQEEAEAANASARISSASGHAMVELEAPQSSDAAAALAALGGGDDEAAAALATLGEATESLTDIGEREAVAAVANLGEVTLDREALAAAASLLADTAEAEVEASVE